MNRTTAGREAAQRAYSVLARPYDSLSRGPGVRRLRRRIVAALDPPRDGVVVEFGCGTGANHGPVRERLGPDGRYLGIDIAPGVLRIARRREAGPRTAFCLGDATRPPVRGAETTAGDGSASDCPEGGQRLRQRPDAVLATFLVGMLSEPARAVRRWARLVGPGGRLALCNLRRTTTPVVRPLNPAFGLAVRLTSPGTNAGGESPVARLDRRVTAAHDALSAVCTTASLDRESLLGGFCLLSAGTVAPPGDRQSPDE